MIPGTRTGGDDRPPVSRREWRVLAICMAIALLDGFDVQTMGVAAPALARAWGIPATALSAVFAAGPAGMLVGALVMGRAPCSAPGALARSSALQRGGSF